MVVVTPRLVLSCIKADLRDQPTKYVFLIYISSQDLNFQDSITSSLLFFQELFIFSKTANLTEEFCIPLAMSRVPPL